MVPERTSRAVTGFAERAGEPVDEDVPVIVQASGGASARYRVRRASPRLREVKVVYGEDEWDAITWAAARAGLRPSGYVAAAALASAQGAEPPTAGSESRELLTELMQSRAAVRRYGTNLNRIAAVMNSGVSDPPVWLAAAVAGAERATARIDEAASVLRRRLA